MTDLKAVNLCKSYGRKQVLSGFSADFPTGLTLLVGPSGGGKSTLTRLLATAEPPDRGQLSWGGAALPGAKRSLRRSLGYAPQSVDLPGDISARRFARHMAALKGLRLAEADLQFLHLAATLNLDQDLEVPLSGWSGGMRRRLIFAQALLGDPALIVLDEPTAELDAESATRVEAALIERSHSATIVMATHQPERLTDHAVATLRIGGMEA
ncbi:ATP-binding cassette domain-containing protein [Sphingosinicella sp. BN140058]|uniref:ATP-binding cassette domain-containing protein n=1 Tax=Sphingosinicella sp. BN140058 TaxID=1892855 RepID=UPI001011E18E|nr:ATP-binding cassette domain-containing protein [Sphingosinicella sp. BN140058]QAY78399.1 ATP-binding cassette domain-containing protein [Sphingosinicella sp. BN140058]